MVEAVKLNTKTDARDAAIADYTDHALKRIAEYRDDHKIAGMVVGIVFKDGSNWTTYTPLDDTLKMVGLLDFMRFETLKTYAENSGSRTPPDPAS